MHGICKSTRGQNTLKLIGMALGIAAICYGILVLGFGGWPEKLPGYANVVAGQCQSLTKLEAAAIRQIVAADNTTKRTIMWQSEVEEPDAVLEYRLKGESAIMTLPTANTEFKDDKTLLYLHTAQLESLMPGQQYEYRIGYGDKRSEWTLLQTDTGKSVKALIFPDSQSNDYSDWEKLAHSARDKNPDAAFFVNMGDLVDNGEDHNQWRAWFDSLRGIIDVIPAAPLLGNHETYDLNWKVRMPEAYLQLFSLPENDSSVRRNQYYSFDYGPVHFIVLNTQTEEMEPLQPGILAEQQKWFAADVEKTDKPWKVVLLHKDVLTYEIKNRSDRKAGISDVGKSWMPLFDQYGVDAVLTAHLHTYRRRDHLYDFKPDNRGPLYILTGVAGNVRYPNLWVNHPFDKAVAPQPETDNYMTLEADAHALKLAAFLPSGEQIDQVELHKGE